MSNNIKTIKKIEKKSPAHKAGLKKGDKVLSINGEPVIDFIDDKYFNTLDELEILVNRKEKSLNFDIKKTSDELLGISWEENLYPPDRQCCNKCKFCFVDQLPEGMRDSLYIRDDDWRYSIAFGNYVTLTNISDDEMDRIIRRHASPLYVSVHAVDGEVRLKLMANKKAARIKEQLEKLAENNISIHTQVVLCPDYNDGKILEETINYLSSLYPHVHSLAVVPVGMTKHRDGLDELTPVNKLVAETTIDFIENFNNDFHKKHNENFVYASDEMYSIAQRKFPKYPDGNYSSLLSDGVGMIYQLNDEFNMAVDFYKSELTDFDCDKKIISLSGTSAYDSITALYNKIKSIAKNINIDVVKIINNTFGNSITVTGLICGQDILNQLINIHPDVIIIPANMLRDGKDTFLDDITIYDIADKLNCTVFVQEIDGYDMIETLFKCQ